MKMKMKSFSLSLACRCFAGALALTMVAPVSAQQWPSKPIRLIVPFPPGQGADVLGRLVADGLSRRPESLIFGRSADRKPTP